MLHLGRNLVPKPANAEVVKGYTDSLFQEKEEIKW